MGKTVRELVRPIEAAVEIVEFALTSSELIRTVRFQAPSIIQAQMPTIAFALGKKETVIVTVCGHNRKQVLVLKAQRPYDAFAVVHQVKRVWESANSISNKPKRIPMRASARYC